MKRPNDPRLAGRLLEGKLVFALICGLAIVIGYVAVTEFILPGFAQIAAALDPVAKN